MRSGSGHCKQLSQGYSWGYDEASMCEGLLDKALGIIAVVAQMRLTFKASQGLGWGSGCLGDSV